MKNPISKFQVPLSRAALVGAAHLVLAVAACSYASGSSAAGGGYLRAVGGPSTTTTSTHTGTSNGGGVGTNSVTVTVTPNPLKANFYQWDMASSAAVGYTMKFPGGLPPQTDSLVVFDSGATFQTGQAWINDNGDGSYSGTLNVVSSLALGTHASNVTFKFCKDVTCKSVDASVTVPYSVVLKVNPTATAKSSLVTVKGHLIQGDVEIGNQVGFQVPSFTLSGTLVYPLYVKISDPAKLIDIAPWEESPQYPVIAGPINGNTFQLALQVKGAVAAGVTNGTATLTLCHTKDCSQVFQGSSTFKYQLKLDNGSRPALVPLAGGSDWSTVQGNAAHTGYVPVTVNDANVNVRWVNDTHGVFSSEGAPIGMVVTTGDKAFTFTEGNGGPYYGYVNAIDETNGTLSWQQMQNGEPLPPAVAQGNVYAPSLENATGPIVKYNPADGTVLGTVNDAFASMDGSYHPLIVPQGSSLYYSTFSSFAGSSVKHHQINRYAAGNGAMQPAPDCLTAKEKNTTFGEYPVPAVDANEHAYIAVQNGLEVVDFGSGATCNLVGASLRELSMPVLLPNKDVLVASVDGSYNPMLFDFDTVNAKVKWSVKQGGSLSPVAAGGVVYVQSSSLSLEIAALSEKDGHVLWSWQPPLSGEWPETFTGNMVITDNTLILSSSVRVYAIDLTSHQTVWSFSAPGTLAVSANGTLYIDGYVLYAVNLQ